MLNLPIFRKGKVRDVYSVGDKLLLVASDRVSAFDYVLPNEIPDKGKILTAISNFWFSKTQHIIKNHLITADLREISKFLPEGSITDSAYLDGRTVLAKTAKRINFECVVRGYLAGAGWKEYQQKQNVAGVKLPSGLKEAAKLPEPIFTPAAKNDTGHDENVPFEVMHAALPEIAGKIKEVSIYLYNFAAEYLLKRGIILADTKFEFGIVDGEIILIDEALTPDSSRLWDAALYKEGTSPVSFDKQFVRDYIEKTGWDKNSAPPQMPAEVIEGAVKKYKEALTKILS